MTTQEYMELTDFGMSVYQHYMGSDVKVRKKYPSPFRNNGEFMLYPHQTKQEIWYSDFGLGDRDANGNCFTFIAFYEGLDVQRNFRDILQIIKSKILMMEGETYSGVRNMTSYENMKKLVSEKVKPRFEFFRREWNAFDKKWFAQWNISVPGTTDLFHVFPVKGYVLHKMGDDGTMRRIAIAEKPSDPIYCIYFPATGHCKMYRPLAADPRFKWVSNVDSKVDIFGWDLLPAVASKGFVMEGNKDTMSFYETMEGMPCFTPNSATGRLRDEDHKLMLDVAPLWLSMADADIDKMQTDRNGALKVVNAGKAFEDHLKYAHNIMPANQLIKFYQSKHGPDQKWDWSKMINHVLRNGDAEELDLIKEHYFNL